MDSIYPALDRTDLHEQAYKVLKERILRRELRPGEKILVEEVARQLGVSRTPVTVALQRLERQGLVEIAPQRGTFVTELTTRDVAQLFDIRLMIEQHAAERMLQAGNTVPFLEAADKAMNSMERTIRDNDYSDYEAFLAADHAFHRALVESSQNPHLLSIYEDLNIHVQVARAHYVTGVERARQAQREHEQIVQTCRAGQPEALRRALTDHITAVKDRILEILRSSGDRL